MGLYIWKHRNSKPEFRKNFNPRACAYSLGSVHEAENNESRKTQLPRLSGLGNWFFSGFAEVPSEGAEFSVPQYLGGVAALATTRGTFEHPSGLFVRICG
jgi:hypothetical protein